MKVGIIGSGGREHSLCLSLKKSNKITNLYCFPGNAGTELLAQNVDIELTNFQKLRDYIKQNQIDIIVIGPEKPLVDGLVDYLEKNEIKVFGPNKIAAQLEGSKIFTKNLCKKYNIPTADFGIFKNLEESKSFLQKCNYPIVIKADGLAAGKGVYICENFEQSFEAAQEIFNGKFGIAKEILVEEHLKGEEMSFFVISDGKTFKKFGTAQDHKRVFEGDKGKNTGGMGAYSPSRLENNKLNQKIISKIIEPTLQGLDDLGVSFKGFLYAGLMINNDEPYLIEYNVRMGDPECQTILPKLKTDFGEIIEACVNRNLNSLDIQWYEESTICIVLCSKGYPEKYNNNIEIKDLSKINTFDNEFIFHAGTKKKNNKIFSNGGRVLNFVTRSRDLKKSRDRLIKLIEDLNWDNGFYRKDIGYRILGE